MSKVLPLSATLEALARVTADHPAAKHGDFQPAGWVPWYCAIWGVCLWTGSQLGREIVSTRAARKSRMSNHAVFGGISNLE
jgi:hypothetical protein